MEYHHVNLVFVSLVEKLLHYEDCFVFRQIFLDGIEMDPYAEDIETLYLEVLLLQEEVHKEKYAMKVEYNLFLEYSKTEDEHTETNNEDSH